MTPKNKCTLCQETYSFILSLFHHTQVESFVKYIGPAGFYGLKKQDTVDSLIISILPPFKFQFKMDRVQVPSDPAEMFEVYVLRLLLEGLRQLLGFNIPHVRAI